MKGSEKCFLRLIDIELFYYLYKNGGFKGCLSNLAREFGLFTHSEIVKFRYRVIRLYRAGYIMIALKRDWLSEIVLLEKGKQVLENLKIIEPQTLSDKVLKELELIKNILGIKDAEQVV